ncbi:MAG: VacJ family lipoprotein [Methylococcales bacterium]|nr:VacJ family lipoprotein [Methylococcales bacterium]
MQKTTINTTLSLTSLAISIALSGCATTDPKDTFQGWNQGTQSFNDTIDKAVFKPVAKGYMAVTPDFVDEGVTNFFSNLGDIGVTVNDLLQFKLLQSGMDLSRFVINTTAGVAGFFDVAKLVDLPKHNEDFGQTLGVWGVPAGPYLVLPLIGPSSPRDTVGLVGDALLNPLTYVSAFGGVAGAAASAGGRAVDITDTRAGLMTTEKVINEGAVDRYDFIKNAYQQHREYLVNDGNSSSNDIDLEDNPPSNNSPSSKTNNPAPAKPTNTVNNTATPVTNNTSSAPAINNPKHTLELSAPVEKK